jgi:hypothetical protein
MVVAGTGGPASEGNRGSSEADLSVSGDLLRTPRAERTWFDVGLVWASAIQDAGAGAGT